MNLLRNIPKIDEIYETLPDELKSKYPREICMDAVREIINTLRMDILSNKVESFELEGIISEVVKRINDIYRYNLVRTVNATGVVIHTNLGRSPLSEKASEAVSKVLSSYSNLEFNLENGQRGERYSHVEDLLTKLTGAEAALVVNNNAAAVMLALSAICSGKEVIVSRGELVEIGGSFRIPEVMKLSGASLKEIGTTNKTHLKDYTGAINEETSAILKVHTSNYRVVGFTSSVDAKDLALSAKAYSIPVIEDLGSGSLIDLSKFGLGNEPTVRTQVEAGIDVVTFSGDKLLGGPQCGIIVGSRKYIDRMKKHQLTRALRIDKMTIAALEATLRHYLDIENAVKEIPVLRMMTDTAENIHKKAEKVKNALGENVEIEVCYSQVGGGSLPLTTMESRCISINHNKLSAFELSNRLRSLEVPIIGRIETDKLKLDMRTVFEEDISYIIDILSDMLEVNHG